MTPSQDFLPLLLLLLPAEGGKHVHGSWRLLGVPAPLWLCIPTSTHATIIPDFYSSSSAVPQILSASQKSSCLTSPLLSPQVCVPKYPLSFPWLSLVYPAHGIWLGRRQGRHQTISPAADAKPEPAKSLLFPQWEQPQICTKLVRCWYHCFNSVSCGFSPKFCPTGSGVLRFNSSLTQLPHSPPCYSVDEDQKEKVSLVG